MSNDEGKKIDPKYELYAQARASGKYISESAEVAGFSGSYGKVLEKKQEVVDRIDELKLERRELAGLDFGEQFRKWNELYNLAVEKGNLKVAKDCLDKIDILGGWGNPDKKNDPKLPGGGNQVLFSGDDPNSTEQLSENVKRVKDIIASTTM